jgi:hypothetical protein
MVPGRIVNQHSEQKPAWPGLSVEDIRVGLRFFQRLPRFLRTPFTLEEARQRVQTRFKHREQRFREILIRLCKGPPDSPYFRLLNACGFEQGDADRLVREEGVEGALATLLRQGVYLTNAEFKSRAAVVRGSLSFTVDPLSLLNPASVVHGLSESSGSRGARTPVPIDLAFVEDHAINTHLALEAYGGGEWVHAHWGVPGGTAVTNPLEFAKGGNPPDRWFTPVLPASPGFHHRYRWGSRAMWLGSRLAGVPMPSATLAELDDLEPVVNWMRKTLDRRRVPHLWTFASTAVLVCETAKTMGIDIAGARFTAGGEPSTRARREAVESMGAIILPRMGATETDILAYACLRPQAPDDMHFFDDRHALVQPGAGDLHGLPPQALLLTSLLSTAPIMLFNVCMGDQAEVVRRDCGCPMNELGWHVHLARVRSFEKLTAGGLTFLDIDVIRILEEVLPGRFGGSPVDYQVVERYDAPGSQSQIQLLLSPDLGVLNHDEVLTVFLEAVGGGSEGERFMELQWRFGNVVEVVRRQPYRTDSGKILHLHTEK